MKSDEIRDCKFDITIKADSKKGLRDSLKLLLNTIDKEDYFEKGNYYKIKMVHNDVRQKKQ